MYDIPCTGRVPSANWFSQEYVSLKFGINEVKQLNIVLYSTKYYNRRQIQFLSSQFWKRWLHGYLPSLQKRQKWCKPRRNIEVYDLILLMESSPRNRWPLARVTEVSKDQKGLVRRVTVRTRGSTYLQRPVDELVLLMEGDGSES